MLQTVKLRRISTKTLVLDVVQPLSKVTLGLVANGQAQGIGAPGPQAEIASHSGAWEVVSAMPACECTLEPLKGRKRGRGK